MNIKILLFLFCVLSFGPTHAFVESDFGTYAVLDSNGLISARAFRISKLEAGWRIENRDQSGWWPGVPCTEDGCQLSSSSESDLKRFFDEKIISLSRPECRQNKVLAFCRYSHHPGESARSYLWVWLVMEGRPLPIRLARLSNLDAIQLERIEALKQKFVSTCFMCHRSGIGNAPRLERPSDWVPRLRQPKEVLYQHAIKGFLGCPSRGGMPSFSDAEVQEMVDYMLAHVEHR